MLHELNIICTFAVNDDDCDMKEKQIEPKLTCALDSSGTMVFIGDVVKRGLACNCRCPKCKELLIARLGHEGGRQRHFAHQRGSDCHGAYITALHMLAEQILEKEKAVMVPAYKEIDSQRLSFKDVEVEKRVERKDIQPDVVGITEDGSRWHIEIRNTHEINELKVGKIKESLITCLEIDVREQTLENLKSFLLNSTEKREWINNPNYESRIEENKRRRVSLIENYISEHKMINLPEHDGYESKTILINDVSVLYSSEDGLFKRIKIDASDGTCYLVNVGYHHVMDDKLLPTRGMSGYYELIIYADDISLEAKNIDNGILFNWFYHCSSEESKELRLNDYRKNSDYEVKSFSCCSSECNLTLVNGKCIYMKDVILSRGIKYVVCNKKNKTRDNAFKNEPVFYRKKNIQLNPEEPCKDISPLISNTPRIQNTEKHFDEEYESVIEYESATLADYRKSLLKEKRFKNSRGEIIEILSCEESKKYHALIVLCQINNGPYYIYGVSISKNQLVISHIIDYTSIKYAERYYNNFIRNWEFNDNDVIEYNPFEQNSSDIFQENNTPLPF